MQIEQELLDQLTDQEAKKNAIYQKLGLLEAEKHLFLHALSEVLLEQEKTKIAIEDKYGKGEVNLKDGSFQKLEQ
jgi:hypothetical protein